VYSELIIQNYFKAQPGNCSHPKANAQQQHLRSKGWNYIKAVLLTKLAIPAQS